MNLVTLDLALRLAISPLLVLTAILIMISSIKIWRKYHLDKMICFTILMVGLALLVIGTADFITNPAQALLWS